MALIFSSCEREYDISKVEDQHVLVIHAFIDGDSTFLFYNGISYFPFNPFDINDSIDAPSILLTNANGVNITLNNSAYENSFYPEIPFVGKSSYYLNVKYPDYNTVNANTKTCGSFEIDNFHSYMTTNIDNYDVLNIKLDVSPEVDKYILVRHITEKKLLSLSSDTISVRDTAWIYPKSENAIQLLPSNSINEALIYNIIPGEINEIEFESYDGFVKENNILEGYSEFEFILCNNDYYKYMKSLIQYKWNYSGNTSSSIITTAGVYSNIVDGLGIFAAYRKKIIKFQYK
ncbi:MAG: DUF4249 family protein [Saprospiraceae bacterium]